MSPRSFAVVAAVLLLLLPVGVAPAVALGGEMVASPADRSGTVGANALPHNGSIDPGDVEMRVEMSPDGDARWRVKTVVSDSISTADERRAFRDFVDEFNETESPLSLDSFVEAADNASRATGREMTVRNVERDHALHGETGAVWVSFTWTNFGRTSGDLLAVDDGFNTTSGVWLSSLPEMETLVVVPPRGYGISSAPTSGPAAASSLANGIARWEGPQDFGQRGPWIVYSGDVPTQTPTATSGRPPTVSPTGTPGDPATGTGTAPGGPGGDGIAGALPFVALVVIGGASAAVLVAYMRREDDGLGGLVGSGDGPDAGAAAADGASGGGETVETAGDAASSADDAATAGGAGAAGSAAGASGATADTDAAAADESDETDDDIDEELLSDEERVERLIEANGGRMKQAAIVQETGWSNAKVSQLLSAMDDDDRIDKLRIGRENLISFPDEDVTDLDSE